MHRLSLVAALAVLAILAAFLPSADSAQARGNPRFGVVQAYEAFPAARDLGLGWQRMRFWWNDAQPNGPTEWNGFATTSDTDIATSREMGMDVVGVIGNPPAWATRNGSVPSGLDQPENHWTRFVERLAREYRGRVDTWIIWNEPDIQPGQPGSTWAGEDSEYYHLLKGAYLAIKRANPNAKVAFAGTTWWADSSRGADMFVERVIRYGRDTDPSAPANGYYFDILPIHVYTNIYQMHDNPHIFRNILAKYGLNKPLWITETNVIPYDDPIQPLPRVPGRATQQEQAHFMVQGVAMALAAGVDRISPYKMTDSIDGNFGEPFGLVRNDYTTRPAYHAYQTAIRVFGNMGNGVWTRKANHHQVEFRAGTRKVTVIWNPNGQDTTTQIRLSGTRAWVVDVAGNQEAIGSPTDGVFDVTLSLGRATAHDGGPVHPIGGPTAILVEEGVGDVVNLPGGRIYFPITGAAIGGAFLDFYRSRGGLELFGYPRSNEFTQDGKIVQYFQRGRMEFDPERSGRPDAVQLTLVNAILNQGVTYPPVADPGAASGRRYFPETQQLVQGAFLTYFNSRGGLDVFGYPISGEVAGPDGRTVQHFQRMRMELQRDGTVVLGLVGDEWMRAQGLLPAETAGN